MSEEEREVSRKDWDRRRFLAFGAFGVFGVGVWSAREWIVGSSKDKGVSAPLRQVLEFNAGVVNGVKSDSHLVQEFPKDRAVQRPKVNGWEGLRQPLDLEHYVVNVNTGRAGDAAMQITLADIKALPRTEIIYDFKCIEGWSQITHWAGVRLKDFAQHYKLGTRDGSTPDNDRPQDLFTYMGLHTPDEKYYVGIDVKSALHPQTILAYEMNGAPLPANQGAPIRLIIPTKYGVKNLKRIGTMFFSDERPRDYWYERGYDYDCAL